MLLEILIFWMLSGTAFVLSLIGITISVGFMTGYKIFKMIK